MQRAVLVLLLLGSTAGADSLGQIEADPLPFANGGYGVQIGLRDPQWHKLRFSIAQFSLHVPDLVSQIGNDGFDLTVRPGSGAIYVLYYLAPWGHDGLCFGGSLRYLRLRYEHDDFPGQHANVEEVSPEAIVGYQWHPFKHGSAITQGFYAQPWLAFGVVLRHSAEAKVGDKNYDEMPISPFFTVNVGWERRF